MGNQLQHYVPRFLLRQFGNGNKEHVHVIDKQSGNQFSFSASKKSAISVAAEYGMYDFEFNGDSLTIEPGLADLETQAADYVSRIVKEKRLDLDDPMERVTLARFLAVQMVRTRAIQETQADLMGRLREWLEKEVATQEFFAPDPFVGEGENAAKAFMAKMICNAPKDYGPALLEKDWLLIATEEKHPFLMGDHPFAMVNDVDLPGRGNLGITCEGIQIYLPLSPTLALALWCPSLQQQLLLFVEKMKGKRMASELSEADRKASRQAVEIVDAINKGVPLMYELENALRFNSLQVIHAERFVFSNQKEFPLVRDMVEKDPLLRRGRRMTEATGKF
jgi:hypothetical protein